MDFVVGVFCSGGSRPELAGGEPAGIWKQELLKAVPAALTQRLAEEAGALDLSVRGHVT